MIDWVHFTPWTSLAGGILIGAAAIMPWLAKEKRRVDARFAELAKAEPGVRFERVIEEGEPAVRILACAAKAPESMIAISSHGRTGISLWVYGSVAEKVLQAATCPVLVVRHTS